MAWIRSIAGRLPVAIVAPSEEGQALIEYELIVSLVALMAIAALHLAGTNVSSILNKIAGEV